jgi:glutathione synthase/RimK-type ligase-like ATP-grasp enzyme
MILIVVNNPKDWQLKIPGVEVVSSKSYLTNPEKASQKNAKVFNLCRSYKYQSSGYYVSLLAAARGQKAMPGIATIQEMKSPAIVRILSDEVDELIQKSLSSLQSGKFTLSIYFGKNLSKKYDKLSQQLFNLFQVPLLRAQFINQNNKWQLQNIGPISTSEISDDHKPYVEQFAANYFAGKKFSAPKRDLPGYNLAILVNPKEEVPPSSEITIKKFIKAAEQLGLTAETITKDDYGILAEYDALFIRETTAVNHYTYRFAQRAAAEGLAVIDDPESIIRCTNKVYLAELLKNHEILHPKTLIVHKDNINQVKKELGFPCILKQPDSSFSQGVSKADTEQEYKQKVNELLEKSSLIVAQEFLPTDFDWRIGIFDREPLYACKYYMASKHWQIMQWKEKGGKKAASRFGKAETFPIEIVPPQLVKTAMQISNLIGDGLYGVDLKQIGNKFYVIEVNDNPSIDHGVEDLILKDKLYTKIMEIFLKKIKKIKEYKIDRYA